MFLPVWRTLLSFLLHLELSSANSFSLKESKIWQKLAFCTQTDGQTDRLNRAYPKKHSFCEGITWRLSMDILSSPPPPPPPPPPPTPWRLTYQSENFIWHFYSFPFPNKPWFLHVSSSSLSKTLWENEKIALTSNFSFSNSVFYPSEELSSIFSELSSALSFSFERSKLCRLVKS